MTVLDKFRTRWGWVFSISERAKAYKLAFRNPSGEIALGDLLTFCGVADEAPRGGDLFSQGRAAGRRDVGLRIMEHIHLTHEELYAVIQGRSILKKEDFQNADHR